MRELNTRYIQVSGKMEIGEALDFEQDRKVLVTVTRIERKNNDDGTYDEIYKAKLFDPLESEQ